MGLWEVERVAAEEGREEEGKEVEKEEEEREGREGVRAKGRGGMDWRRGAEGAGGGEGGGEEGREGPCRGRRYLLWSHTRRSCHHNIDTHTAHPASAFWVKGNHCRSGIVSCRNCTLQNTCERYQH